MVTKSKALDVFMENSRQAIANALSDDEIKALLLPYNYDEARLNEGLALYQKTDQVFEQQKQDYVRQYEAKEKFDNAFKEAQALYIEHISLTRLSLDEQPNKWKMLSLSGKRSQKLATWVRAARRFYNNSIDNKEIVEQLARFGVSNEKLQEGKQMVELVEKTNDDHDKARGAAQQSTEERNKALKKLGKWISAYTTVCRFALKDKPQLLEKLGILVLSEGYKRKPAETQDQPPAGSQNLEAQQG